MGIRWIIRKYMDAEKVTVKRLSELTGIGRVNLGNKLKGNTAMTVEELISIVKVLDIDDRDLVKGIKL